VFFLNSFFLGLGWFVVLSKHWLLISVYFSVLFLGAGAGATSSVDASVSFPPKITEQERLLANGARFESAPCWFDVASEKKSLDLAINCGWFHTAPPAGSNKSAFQLPVVIFSYQKEDREADPLVYLAGGPGAGAWLDSHNIRKFWLPWYKKNAALKRDLILFDQRGSGMSEPQLICPEFHDSSRQVFSNPGTPVENAQLHREAAQTCYDRLQALGIPVNQLGTPHSADDVAQLLTLLGYKEWNLYGVSYGTRLAIEVQTRYPEKVRSLVLDSVYSPNAHLFREWPKLYRDSIERIFEYCERTRECSISSDLLRNRLRQLLTRLRHRPIIVPVDVSLGVGLEHVVVNDETFLGILFNSEYTSGNLAILPMLINDTYIDDTELLQVFVDEYVVRQFETSFNDAAFWAVECQDNPQVEPFPMEHNPDYSILKYYLPSAYNVCDIWRDNSQRKALASKKKSKNLPVLIFSGEDDPITPIDWAISTAAFYDNKPYLFTFSGVSHSVMDTKHCTKDLFVNFLQTPGVRPQADCQIERQDNNSSYSDSAYEQQDSQPRERLRIRLEPDSDNESI
jgi:pimeloyl-ACP methyl ester carboxylesterase